MARVLALDHNVSIFTSCDSDCEIDGVQFVAVRPKRRTFSTNGFRNPLSTLRFIGGLLLLFFDKREFDIVDCNATPFLHVPIAARLARHWGASMVLTAHEGLSSALNNYAHERVTHPILQGLAHRVLKIVYHNGMKNNEMIVTPSSIAAQAIRAEGYRNVAVNLGGVSSIAPPKERFLRRATFVGRLVVTKRVDVLIRAALNAAEKGWIESLTIVGTGPQRDELLKLTGVHDLGSIVKFAGDVSEDEKFEILRDQTDVFVSASMREGISLATLEAMSMANPVIIATSGNSTANGAVEYVRNGVSGFVTNGREEELTNAIYQFVKMNETDYRIMSAASREVAQNYLWKPGVDHLLNLYRTLLIYDELT